MIGRRASYTERHSDVNELTARASWQVRTNNKSLTRDLSREAFHRASNLIDFAEYYAYIPRE